MSNKVVVFGGSGYLGSYVSDCLSLKGYDVTIFDLKESQYIQPNQKMVEGDILDLEKVKNVAKDQDYVYNFAGMADLDSSTTQPIETIKLNLEGTLNILQACKDEDVKRFVFASSIYVYSNKGGFYRCSKQAAEIYIEEFQQRYNVDFTILRYGTLYGPRANENNSAYRYIKQALEDKKIRVAGDGEEIREYIHVRDAAELSVKVLNDEFKNGHYIITGHHPMRLKDLLGTLTEMLKDKVKIEYKPGTNPHHYSMTPYSYIPKIGKKLTSNCYTDLGQGLLECLEQFSDK
ncbi:MAG: NAD(P)-dependent oxidoreductase [Candidatus Omnitrophica bacterium]|nr:NAD(P)-dependent oxidoreductase [Candidatus Omnitrophota bacterium]MBU1997587.1 NAD(P)-dependent oxidoreductase [Candidatus Omnitrophota bacterium]MBU4334743.1 NAD(P)-dependent oxidoreductase [Candidatus Omnitrophota bacterium]